jgi:hypothetical protein
MLMRVSAEIKGRIYGQEGTDLRSRRDGFTVKKGRIYGEKGHLLNLSL